MLIARRIGDDGPEIILPGHEWQMPQGGIDPGEDPEAAARRELCEETGVAPRRSSGPSGLADLRLPALCGPPHRLARFRGQRQRWFAMRFTGAMREIDVTRAAEGAPPEFSDWRWERLDAVAALIVPFKREIYREIARAFAPFARPA